VTDDQIRFVEVAPRDGLQNAQAQLSIDLKIEFCRRLLSAGVRHLEVGSFVSPHRVPQMADSAAVVAGLADTQGVELVALAPNSKGVERALESRIDTVAVFVAASEGFALANTNCSIAECLARAGEVVGAARAAGRRSRGYVSCITHCPIDGEVATNSVVHVAEALLGIGCDEIALGDTLGTTRPSDMRRLLAALDPSIPVAHIAVHCHDTYGMACASTLAAVDYGVRSVDGAVAGLGGCPFAPGAKGNAASEDLVFMLEGLGMRTGIDLDALALTGEWISRQLAIPNDSRTGSAMIARRAVEP
jgi:hydroxymethylglutaryl-CoA lyase